MPKPPPPPPKGTRHPGAGRAKGTPNKISVEARQLASQLVTDKDYQFKLREDFRRRRVHPTIESLIWQYHLGRPTLPVTVSGSLALDVTARLDEERRVFETLDTADLEQLAAESQALVNRAYELSRIAQNTQNVLDAPLDVVVQAALDAEDAESLGNTAESDKVGYVNLPSGSDETP